MKLYFKDFISGRKYLLTIIDLVIYIAKNYVFNIIFWFLGEAFYNCFSVIVCLLVFLVEKNPELLVI